MTDTKTPTAFPELNGLLQDFVRDVRDILAGDVLGVYLQGSFALGAADEYSDVDFLVVTAQDASPEQTVRLNALHARLFDRDSYWAKHLEGSYVPAEDIRQVDKTRRPFLFLDNGAHSLVNDAHCNSAVTRWITREHGITLYGPEPRTLIDPVADADLKSEALVKMKDYIDWAVDNTHEPMSQWKQTYVVLTLCRIVHTFEVGTVKSKQASADWAADVLDPEWTALIRNAAAGRADPWERINRPADTTAADQTIQFAEYLRSRFLG